MHRTEEDLDDICPVCDSTCTCVPESSQEDSEIDVDENNHNYHIDIDDSDDESININQPLSTNRPRTGGKDIWVQKYLETQHRKQSVDSNSDSFNNYIDVSTSPLTSPIFGYQNKPENDFKSSYRITRSSSISSIGSSVNLVSSKGNRKKSSSAETTPTKRGRSHGRGGKSKVMSSRVPKTNQRRRSSLSSSPIYSTPGPKSYRRNSNSIQVVGTTLSPVSEKEDIISDIDSMRSADSDIESTPIIIEHSILNENISDMEDLSIEGSDNEGCYYNSDISHDINTTFKSSSSHHQLSEIGFESFDELESEDNLKIRQLEEDYLIQKVMAGDHSWDSQLEDFDSIGSDLEDDATKEGNGNYSIQEQEEGDSFLAPNHPWYQHRPVYLSDLLDEPPRKCPTLTFDIDSNVALESPTELDGIESSPEVNEEMGNSILPPVFKGNAKSNLLFADQLHKNKIYMEENHSLLSAESNINLPNSSTFKPLSSIPLQSRHLTSRHNPGQLPDCISTGWSALDSKLVYDSFRSCPVSANPSLPNSPPPELVDQDLIALSKFSTDQITKLMSFDTMSEGDKCSQIAIDEVLDIDLASKSPEVKPHRNGLESRSAEALARWDRFPVTAFRHHLNNNQFDMSSLNLPRNTSSYYGKTIRRYTVSHTPNSTPMSSNTPISSRATSPDITKISDGIKAMTLNINDSSLPPSFFMPAILGASPIIPKAVETEPVPPLEEVKEKEKEKEKVRSKQEVVKSILKGNNKNRNTKNKSGIKTSKNRVRFFTTVDEYGQSYCDELLLDNKPFSIQLLKLNKRETSKKGNSRYNKNVKNNGGNHWKGYNNSNNKKSDKKSQNGFIRRVHRVCNRRFNLVNSKKQKHNANSKLRDRARSEKYGHLLQPF
ncbi:hypothetical protein K502DRAFT_344178 [Neoconidiobolus thromboides FSU 785]|nr:hypothetical protein K502DRAFT_344178 [Neoconidiobolus thromboides FSU 785]